MKKITFHIPTEQFGFTEVEIDEAEKMTYEEAKSLYGLPTTPGEGLETKVFNKSLDEYLTTNTLKDGANLYQQMSSDQKKIFQEIKKCLKRIDDKNK